MLSKLRYHSNQNILRITYHSLFGSHLLYLLDTLTLYKLFKTPFFSLCNKISFKKRCDSTNQLYRDLKILKFSDFFHLQNCLLLVQ